MPRDDDEYDDRPRRRRPWDGDDDSDDRPRRRRDDDEDEDDEFDDRPRGRRRLSREVLRGIAGNQKAIILCILAYLCLTPLLFVIPDAGLVVVVTQFLVSIAGTVFVFLLATKVYSTGVGVLLGILTLIPCVGLIVLLIINAKATAILQTHGVRVGLLGARGSDI